MACSSCPGGNKAGALQVEAVRQMRVDHFLKSSTYTAPPKGQEMILILYTSKNIAQHNVQSPMRPRTLSGNIITSYGRRRGAHASEIEMVDELGTLTVEKATELGLLNKCVFFVHPVDIAAQPELFRIIDHNMVVEKVDALSVEDKEEIVSSVDDFVEARAFINFDITGMTKGIATSLVENGWVTIEDLLLADPNDIADSMTATKTMTQLERAAIIIESAKAYA